MALTATLVAFTMPQALSPAALLLSYRHRYRYRTAKGCPSPKLRFFHRVKDAFTSSSAAKSSSSLQTLLVKCVRKVCDFLIFFRQASYGLHFVHELLL